MITRESLSDDLREHCAHRLFEAQAIKTPEKVAVTHKDYQLTYSELNARANRLANHLQRAGVYPGTVVGLSLERSVDTVVGILAILKAGGTYVPLDPGYPEEWQRFILNETRAQFLLTEGDAFGAMLCRDTECVSLSIGNNSFVDGKEDYPDQFPDPRDLAYIMYTSGSSGTPKGVQMEHASVWHYIQSINSVLHIGSNDIYLHTASFAFSSSVRQMLLPLSVGARLVIADRAQVQNPAGLFELIREESITVFDTVQTIVRHGLQLLRSSPTLVTQPVLGHKLSTIVFSGDLLPRQLIKQIRQSLDRPLRIFNVYGQTETIGVCCYPVPEDFDYEFKPVPVGYPLPHIHDVRVLGRDGREVAKGKTGEISVAGSSICRGYLQDDALNEDRFKFLPCKPGAATPPNGTLRFYRTGDVGRIRKDGIVEILGRLDQQVKILGIRVELAEIEAALASHNFVKEAVVAVTDDAPERKLLVGYVVPTIAIEVEDENRTKRMLRHYLRQLLPDHMIPATFVFMDRLPKTINGKIARARIPRPKHLETYNKDDRLVPPTQIQAQLCVIWSKILGSNAGIYDDFFELGGNSIDAAQILFAIQEQNGVELSFSTLFDHPTIEELSQCIEKRRKSPGGYTQKYSPLRRGQSSEMSLSFAQERLWFLNQLEDPGAAYNVCRAVRLDGVLQIELLKRAVTEIVSRHEVLRTRIRTVAGQPMQLISPPGPIVLNVTDLSQLSEQEREMETQRIMREDARRPFQLENEPLWRISLLRLGADAHVLVLIMHHIISDDWSVAKFFGELGVFYKAYAVGSSGNLPELPIQYADYSAWQREWMTGEVLAEQISYWKEQLEGAPAVLSLPTDRPRPAVQTFRGAKHPMALSRTLVSTLRGVSQQERATLFMLLLAAFHTLLYRYSGQSDVVTGVAVANRNLTQLEGLIGLFVNTLVLRTDFSGNPPFLAVLRRVRENTLAAYAHQDLPFEKLVEVLQPERDLSLNPLFQVMFTFQNAPGAELSLPGLSVEGLGLDKGAAQFDLTLSLRDDGSALMGWIEYNTDLFDAATIARMAGHFQSLLNGIAADSKQRIEELRLLTTGEREQLLVEWNATRADFPRDVCIHQLFEAQVKRTPEAVAVCFEEEALTYHELNQRANQVARRLQALGVEPGALVGICVERSLELVVGVLGVLKAGGAYVPLDPSYPHSRLELMLTDAKVVVLVTQQALLETLPAQQVRTICLDGERWTKAQEQQSNPVSKVDAGDHAYVIYTSGSTGRPKGVEVPHRGVVNLLTDLARSFELTAQDSLLAVTTLSFDIAALEIFLPLIVGARVVLVDREKTTDGNLLREQLTDWKPTVMQATPSTWRLLIEADWPGSVQLTMLCGGEPLAPDLAEELLKRGRSLWNLYGPTETTIWSTAMQVKAPARVIEIGRPIANTQIYLLDAHGEPVPIGVPGELYIGGAGLADGYRNRPVLTAERFILHPFSNEPGARLYRTGDLARYHSDGNIEFLGRLDHQVKLRGFRIELGEVEAVLQQHPAMRQVAVALREDHPGDQRLVAYWVGDPDAAISIRALHAYLREKLPDYMVPAAFVRLDKLPLTPNGKLDRRALPAPTMLQTEPTDDFVGPTNPIEEMLLPIWQELLALSPLTIYDNFFEVGGHSLLAVRLISRIRDTFGLELSLQELFSNPTIAQLAITISAKLVEDVDKSELIGLLTDLAGDSITRIEPNLLSGHDKVKKERRKR